MASGINYKECKQCFRSVQERHYERHLQSYDHDVKSAVLFFGRQLLSACPQCKNTEIVQIRGQCKMCCHTLERMYDAILKPLKPSNKPSDKNISGTLTLSPREQNGSEFDTKFLNRALRPRKLKTSSGITGLLRKATKRLNLKVSTRTSPSCSTEKQTTPKLKNSSGTSGSCVKAPPQAPQKLKTSTSTSEPCVRAPQPPPKLNTSPGTTKSYLKALKPHLRVETYSRTNERCSNAAQPPLRLKTSCSTIEPSSKAPQSTLKLKTSSSTTGSSSMAPLPFPKFKTGGASSSTPESYSKAAQPPPKIKTSFSTIESSSKASQTPPKLDTSSGITGSGSKAPKIILTPLSTNSTSSTSSGISSFSTQTLKPQKFKRLADVPVGPCSKYSKSTLKELSSKEKSPTEHSKTFHVNEKICVKPSGERKTPRALDQASKVTEKTKKLSLSADHSSQILNDDTLTSPSIKENISLEPNTDQPRENSSIKSSLKVSKPMKHSKTFHENEKCCDKPSREQKTPHALDQASKVTSKTKKLSLSAEHSSQISSDSKFTSPSKEENISLEPNTNQPRENSSIKSSLKVSKPIKHSETFHANKKYCAKPSSEGRPHALDQASKVIEDTRKLSISTAHSSQISNNYKYTSGITEPSETNISSNRNIKFDQQVSNLLSKECKVEDYTKSEEFDGDIYSPRAYHTPLANNKGVEIKLETPQPSNLTTVKTHPSPQLTTSPSTIIRVKIIDSAPGVSEYTFKFSKCTPSVELQLKLSSSDVKPETQPVTQFKKKQATMTQSNPRDPKASNLCEEEMNNLFPDLNSSEFVNPSSPITTEDLVTTLAGTGDEVTIYDDWFLADDLQSDLCDSKTTKLDLKIKKGTGCKLNVEISPLERDYNYRKKTPQI